MPPKKSRLTRFFEFYRQIMPNKGTDYQNRKYFRFLAKIGNQKRNRLIGCRFNKNNIIERIQTVARFRDQILLYHRDACELMVELLAEEGNGLFF